MSDDSDRTYDPTPQRRERFRKEGRYAKARDAGPIVAGFAVIGALVGGRRAMSAAIETLFQRTLGDVTALSRGDGPKIVAVATGALATIALPAAVLAAVASTAIGVAQAGVRFDPSQIGLKADRLNPLPRLQQLFDPKHAMLETAMSVLRIGAVAVVAWRALLIELPGLLAMAREPAASTMPRLIDVVTRVAIWAMFALLLVAGADYAQSRFQHEKQLKMTRKELQDEMRSEEGDMKAKARMRQRARQLLKKRSLEGVKTASVVVTNPTHVAVALRYTAKDPAPVVVAKGVDEVALEIRARARKHGIPIVENRPLARALEKETPVGKPIPVHHFSAVARVLAWVYKVRGMKRA